IAFTHHNGAFGKKYLPETMGVGPAFFDVDRDGDPDLMFANGSDWPEKRTAGATATGAHKTGTGPRLYLNDGHGSFTDVTAAYGLQLDTYGMGIAAADYDNDGWVDLLLTAVGQNRLLRNTGKGTFVDVTTKAGLGGREAFSTSALWVDIDKDGYLDLLVCNYVKWTPQTDIHCSADGRQKSYCTPEAYRGSTSWLFRNRGNGTFEDITATSGLFDVTSKSLGATILDYDQDGWPDLFIANDTQPNKLYRNNRNGTFTEEGIPAGVAYSEDGVARGAMGVDAADYDRSGRPHLIVGNFSNQMLGLYHNEGKNLFVDEAPRSSIGRASLLSLAFGVFFFDYDLDGALDILAANGHIEEEIEQVQPKVKFRQPPLLFRNAGQRKFENASTAVGAQFSRPILARGAAYGDYDRDGDLDVLFTENSGSAWLYRNDGGNANHFISIRTRGVKSNRDGIGAVVRVTSAVGTQWSMVRSGSSYCSQSDLALTFGLGKDTQVSTIEIEWPSGQKDRLNNIPSNQHIVVEEGKGIVTAK
ncbi:MAG TPA: CRTAC1 family protein, partial [Vicinamibacterales bacterium]